MSDIRLQIKIKSSRILRAMEKVGIYTIAELARAMETPKRQTALGELVNMKASPLLKDGGWRPISLNLATALHREPDELWPEYLRYVELQKNEVSVDMSMEEFETLASNPNHLLRSMAVREAIAQLPDRLRNVMELRYGLNGNGEHTLQEVAALTKNSSGQQGLSVERVRSLEDKALRRLREMHRFKRLGLSEEDLA